VLAYKSILIFQFALRDAAIIHSFEPAQLWWWVQDFERKVGKDGTNKSKDSIVFGLHV
jgi:hypothetical protein